MAKKKNNNNNKADGGAKTEEQKKSGGGGGGGGDQKEEKAGPLAVVLKVEMDCEGCVSKIIDFAKKLQGVESVKAEMNANKLTVIGSKIDPSEIRETLQKKTKKKVDVISPQPKKENPKNDAEKPKNDDNKKANDTKQDVADAKKPKEPPVTTAVLKLAFHCQGCVDKIKKIVSKTKGVQEKSFDQQKETVTVKGTMDAKALAEALKERLKRPVEIVPPKKEKDGEKDGEKDSGAGGKKKGGGGGGQDNAGGGADGVKMEGRMEFMVQPGLGPGFGYMGQPVYGNGYMPVYGNGYMVHPQPVYGYEYGYGPGYGHGPEHGYGYGPVPGYPVHMKFNDENPNACSIM